MCVEREFFVGFEWWERKERLLVPLHSYLHQCDWAIVPIIADEDKDVVTNTIISNYFIDDLCPLEPLLLKLNSAKQLVRHGLRKEASSDSIVF